MRGQYLDYSKIIGSQFGRLIVLKKSKTLYKYECLCVCGKTATVHRYDLIKSHTQSCGCLQQEATAAASRTHGLTHTPTYNSWYAMRQRCHYKGSISYPRYGARGIKVCKRWRDSFKNFITDMGTRPKGYYLDRIDNSGDYTPSNCKWSTKKDQARNRRTSRMITAFGKTKCIAAWAEESNYTSPSNQFRHAARNRIKQTITSMVNL